MQLIYVYIYIYIYIYCFSLFLFLFQKLFYCIQYAIDFFFVLLSLSLALSKVHFTVYNMQLIIIEWTLITEWTFQGGLFGV